MGRDMAVLYFRAREDMDIHSAGYVMATKLDS